jgi:exodeoxyribonuclease V alpha subunit
VVRFGCSFGSGDKVMQTVNDYDNDVFNGDLGFVRLARLYRAAAELLSV